MQRQLTDYHIQFHAHDQLLPSDVDDVALRITGDVVYVEYDVTDDQEPVETNVGHMLAYYFPVFSGREDGFSIFDQLDAVSGDAEECFEALFDGEELREDIVDNMFEGDVISSDILYVANMELLPDHRGSGLGLAVIRKVIERFAPRIGLVAIIPFPQVSSNSMYQVNGTSMQRIAQDPAIGRQKLRDYYGRLGFRQDWRRAVHVCEPVAPDGQRTMVGHGDAAGQPHHPTDGAFFPVFMDCTAFCIAIG